MSPHTIHSAWKAPHVSHLPTFCGYPTFLGVSFGVLMGCTVNSTMGNPSQKIRPFAQPALRHSGHAKGSKSAIRSKGTMQMRTVSCARLSAAGELPVGQTRVRTH